MEFATRGVPFRAQETVRLEYKGRPLRQSYTPDFVCFGAIIIELKAVRAIAPEHQAQIINYLRATGMRLEAVRDLEARSVSDFSFLLDGGRPGWWCAQGDEARVKVGPT